MSAPNLAAPTSYRELAELIVAIGFLVHEKRRREGLSLREAADQLNVSTSTLCRMENGDGVLSYSLVSVLRWLDGA